MTEVSVRPARCDDWPTLVQFNQSLADETEGRRLDAELLARGVQAVLKDAGKGRYFVAEQDGRLVGQLLQTFEWSDWRNGMLWWVQSVYVAPCSRRRGVFRRLLEHLAQLAGDDPSVVGLRLYVEHDNSSAKAAYLRLGFKDAGYDVWSKPGPADPHSDISAVGRGPKATALPCVPNTIHPAITPKPRFTQ